VLGTAGSVTGHPLQKLRLLKRRDQILVQARDDLGRRARWSEKSRPGREIECGHTRLRGGRDIGYGRLSARPDDRERAHFPRLDLRRCDRGKLDRSIDLPADEIG